MRKTIRKSFNRAREDKFYVFLKRVFKAIYFNCFSRLSKHLTSWFLDSLCHDSRQIRELSEKTHELEEKKNNLVHRKKVIDKLPETKKVETVESKGQDKFNFNSPFVAEVHDCFVIGNNSTAYKNDKAIPETIGYRNERVPGQIKTDIGEVFFETFNLQIKGRTNPEKTLETAMILNSQFTGYYHWVIDHLAKLRSLEEYKRKTGNEVKLIIPSNPSSFITQSLELLASDMDIIEAKNKAFKVNKLIVPSFPEPTIKNIEWFQRKAAEESEKREDLPSKIFISRQGSNARKIQNYQEVEKKLREQAIEPVKLEEYTFKEQVNIFSNADVVIGAHGAGLVNMIWPQSELRILEISNEHFSPLYGIIARNSGHQHDILIGDSVGTAYQERNRDILVDTEELEEKVQKLEK